MKMLTKKTLVKTPLAEMGVTVCVCVRGTDISLRSTATTATTTTISTVTSRVQKNLFFKPKPLGFIGFCALLNFQIFLFERVVGKLVGCFSSSAKLLFRFASSLDCPKNLHIHYLLVVRSYKHKETF